MIAEQIGLGVLLRWKDKASGQMKKAQKNVEGLSGSMDAASKSTKNLERGYANLAKVGAGITALGIAGAVAIYGTVKAASAFQESLRDTMTMTGLTGAAFDAMEGKLGKTSLQMSTRFGMAASDINKSFYQVLSSGAKAGTKQFTALSDTALMLAKTVGLEPAIAVEKLSDTLHAFEMDVSQAGKAADVLFKASMLGATTVPQLTEAMVTAAPTAKALGMSLEETTAILTGFASKGIKGAEAGTAFRMVFARIADKEGPAFQKLTKAGIKVFDTQTKKFRGGVAIIKDLKAATAKMTDENKLALISAVAGQEGFAKLAGLMEIDTSIITGWQSELKKTGALQVAFKQKMDTFTEKWNVAKSTMQKVVIVIGTHLLPIFGKIADAIKSAADEFAGFAEAYPILTETAVGLGLTATAVALVLGPLLMFAGIFGMLGGAPAIVANISKGFSSLGPVVRKQLPDFIKLGKLLRINTAASWLWAKRNMSAATAMKAAGSAIWGAVKASGAWIGSLVKSIALKVAHTAVLVVGTVATWAITAASKAATVAQWLWNAAMVANPIGLIIAGVAALIGGIVLLVKNWDAVTGAVVNAYRWWKNLLGETPDWLLAIIFPIGLVIKHFQKIKTTVISVFSIVGSTISKVFTAIKDTIGGAIDWIWDKITWVISKIPDSILDMAGFGGLKGMLGAGTTPIGGQTVIPATAPAVQRAVPRPTIPREVAMPVMAMAGGGGGSYDQSVRIEPGAVVIHANKIDEAFAMQLDAELGKIIERRRERR